MPELSWPRTIWKLLTPNPQPTCKEEDLVHRRCLLSDAVIIPAGFAAQLALTRFLGRLKGTEYTTANTSRVAAWTAAGLAVFALYQHVVVCPKPKKDDKEMFFVQSKIGRWVFLTRHVLALQAFHSVISIMDPTNSHVPAFPLAGMGFFVTMQYFSLVHFHPDFISSCSIWAKKGVPFKALMITSHLPGAIVALLDTLYVKDRALLLAVSPTSAQSLLFYLGYCVFYLSLVHINHHATGEWPYGVMKPLGDSVAKWTTFAGVQSVVLLSMYTLLHVLAYTVPIRG